MEAQDARIVYVAMYETQAKYLLCAAFNIGFYGPKIVWMFPGWYARTFWLYGLYRVNCSAQNMSAVVEGSFMFSSIYQNPVEERGPANLTVSEFYDKMRSDPRYWPSAYEFAAGRLYDHVWLVAVALNCTINRLNDLGYNKSLDEFTYRDGDINQLIYDCMGSTSMVGIAGRISFETGDPDRIVSVERIQGGEQELIAYYRQDQTPSYYEWQDGVLKWKDGLIPRDSTYVVYEELLLSSTVYICMCNLAAIGILLALAFLTFNIYHRRNRGVQRSAPNINIILLLGCVLCYATAFFKSTDTNNATVCTLRVTTFTMGMTVTVGSLFSKTWLVHKFLTKSERQDWRVNDLQLLSIIGLVVAVVTVILITWEAVAPHHILIQYLQHQVYTIGNDVEVRPFVRVCHSEYTDYFSWAIYIIEGALLSLCAFLSFETRHVRVLHLNDSRQFGMCVYNAVLLSLASLVLSLLLTQEAAMLYGITSGCLIIGATVTQLLVFVPKMTSIYHGVDVGDDDTDLASTNPPHAASSGFRVLSTHN